MLSTEEQARLAPYLKYDSSGTPYYDLPSTDPKEIGASMADTITTPEAQAQIQSAAGQEAIVNQLLQATDPSFQIQEATSTSTALSDEETAALLGETDTTSTGSYQNTPAAAVAGPVTDAGGTYTPTQGYVATDASGTAVQATTGDSYTTSPNFNATTSWTGGGYDPSEPDAGGYNPATGYAGTSNTIGGQAAVSENFTGAPSYAGGYYGDQTESTGGGYDPTTASLTDPTNARNAVSGLKTGGSSSAPPTSPSVNFQSQAAAAGAAAADKDWRVRISLADKAKIFYKDPSGSNKLMAPLIQTNGVIFPYLPTISITHGANYTSATPTHSNYALHFYNNSEVTDITITGDFSVQSVDEGQYLMAVVYFLRSATKMFFGTGENVGNPPPIVFLDGYGSHYFPHVPCVIQSFTHNLTPDVDYIEIPMPATTVSASPTSGASSTPGVNYLDNAGMQNIPGSLVSTPPTTAPVTAVASVNQAISITPTTRVPTNSSITIQLKPVYSRSSLHDRFDLNKFASGSLLKDPTTGRGGFL